MFVYPVFCRQSAKYFVKLRHSGEPATREGIQMPESKRRNSEGRKGGGEVKKKKYENKG